ncbi:MULTISPECIES: 4'-phosphopantetheinyl transferase family protein [unclassified Luteimonas]
MRCSPDPQQHPALEQAFLRCLRDDGPALAAQAEAGVLVAMFDLEDWQPYLSRAAALIDAQEAARVARQRLAPNRDVLVLAYALHRLLLSQVLGCGSGDVPLVRDAKGCPRLRDDRLFTSLSHAGQRVAIAIAGAGPIGIDVEPASRAPDMPELAERVAHPEELRELAYLAPGALGEALLAMWVRKEALLKAAGIGLEREMDSFVAPWGVALALPGDTFPGRSVELRALHDPGWACAVAVPPGAAIMLATPARGGLAHAPLAANRDETR